MNMEDWKVKKLGSPDWQFCCGLLVLSFVEALSFREVQGGPSGSSSICGFVWS